MFDSEICFVGADLKKGVVEETLMFVVLGILSLIVTSIAYFYPHLRALEDELPDTIASS